MEIGAEQSAAADPGPEDAKDAPESKNLVLFKDSRVAATNDQTGVPYQVSAFDPTPTMKTPVDLFRRGYELLVSGAKLFQSPFLLLLRIYFFWQLFQTGQGKLAHIEKISDYFASLGNGRQELSPN